MIKKLKEHNKMYDFKAEQKVMFKSWEEMEKEFGLARYGAIFCKFSFAETMKHLCNTIFSEFVY